MSLTTEYLTSFTQFSLSIYGLTVCHYMPHGFLNQVKMSEMQLFGKSVKLYMSTGFSMILW